MPDTPPGRPLIEFLGLPCGSQNFDTGQVCTEEIFHEGPHGWAKPLRPRSEINTESGAVDDQAAGYFGKAS